jgi:hypothetical protein
MPTTSSTTARRRRPTAAPVRDEATRAGDTVGEAGHGDHSYVLPLVHVRLPERLVEAGFWGGLAGSVALGAVDPPLGLLVGVGTLVARHHAGNRPD